ncbi:unnamed protein product [Symbiodinium necroappetens]|uniref:Uncharacterized protein n=1 Tax=Symbiodinium necroappetens TaxID=1628268 RepID=A0A812XFW5_9DINO|nr:unnamed protein product [Symbiodinium necroappetens]
MYICWRQLSLHYSCQTLCVQVSREVYRRTGCGFATKTCKCVHLQDDSAKTAVWVTVALRELRHRNGFLVGRTQAPLRSKSLSLQSILFAGEVMKAPPMTAMRKKPRQYEMAWKTLPERRFVFDPKSFLPVPRGGWDMHDPSWPDIFPTGRRGLAPLPFEQQAAEESDRTGEDDCMTAARNVVNMACKPLQRRWFPEQFRTPQCPRWEMLFAEPCPSSCSRRFRSSPASQPRPKERQKCDAFQDVIVHLLHSGRAKVMEELYQVVCDFFASQGHQALSASLARQVREDQDLNRFRAKLRKILEKHLSPGTLSSVVDAHHLNVEEMQANLYDALSQDGDLEMDMGEHGGTSGYSDMLRMMSMQQQRPLQGTEERPLHERRVMDVQVSWTHLADKPAHMPNASKSILLSNLPLTATESDIRAALSTGCGEVQDLEMCDGMEDWMESIRRPDGGLASEAMTEDTATNVSKAASPYTLRYAIVQFHDPSAKRRATRKLPRLNGILLKEVLLLKKRTKWKDSVVARPAFPQDARWKRSLILRDLPRLQPSEVLGHVAAGLSANGKKCRLELLNCAAFAQTPSILQRFIVEGKDGTVTHEDGDSSASQMSELQNSSNPTWAGHGTALVLRFACFEEAYLARKHLKDLSMEGRAILCEFPPWRPVCTAVDSRGRGLDEPVLLDMPIPRASARYGPRRLNNDPVIRFGVVEEEFE